MNFRQQYQQQPPQNHQYQQHPSQHTQYQQQQYPQPTQHQQFQQQQQYQPGRQQQSLRPNQSGPATSYNNQPQNYGQDYMPVRSQSVAAGPSQLQQQQYLQQQQQQSQQPLQPQQSVKGGLWSRLRSQLTVSSGDHDGETEDETVLATALVKFYAENKGGIPSWLATAKAARAYSGNSNGNNSPTTVTHGVIRPSGNSSLQEIYKRSNTTSSAQYQAPNYNSNSGGIPMATAVSNPGHENGGGSWRTGGGAGAGYQQAPDKNDRFRTKLRSAGRPTIDSSGSNYNNSAPPPPTKSTTASWKSKATW